MRIHTSLPVAFLSLGMLASAGCTDHMPELTAPETTASALLAPTEASYQQNNTGQATFGNLIAALNNITLNINNLEALNDLTIQDVRVISADNLLRGANINALNNALNQNDVDINVLRDFLNNSVNNNTVIVRDVLDVGNINVDDVIAISVLSGEVTVFTM